MSVPDFLPTISAGAHDSGDGEACVMEYVSLLAGEEWSDRPECTHPLLAHEARTVNDLLADDDRGRLVPLVGRLFGTTDDSDELRARLRLRQVRQVLQLVEPSARASVLAYVERAEALVGAESDVLDDEVLDARRTVQTFRARTGTLDAEHEQFHVQSARIMAFAASPELGAAEAWALVALSAAHVLAASECRADCSDARSRSRRMVKDLTALLDEYDAVTGRATTTSTPEQVRELAATL